MLSDRGRQWDRGHTRLWIHPCLGWPALPGLWNGHAAGHSSNLQLPSGDGNWPRLLHSVLTGFSGRKTVSRVSQVHPQLLQSPSKANALQWGKPTVCVTEGMRRARDSPWGQGTHSQAQTSLWTHLRSPAWDCLPGCPGQSTQQPGHGQVIRPVWVCVSSVQGRLGPCSWKPQGATAHLGCTVLPQVSTSRAPLPSLCADCLPTKPLGWTVPCGDPCPLRIAQAQNDPCSIPLGHSDV